MLSIRIYSFVTLFATPKLRHHGAQETCPHRRRRCRQRIVLLEARRRRRRRTQAHAERRRTTSPLTRRPLARRAAHRLRPLRRGRRVQGAPGGAGLQLGVLPESAASSSSSSQPAAAAAAALKLTLSGGVPHHPSPAGLWRDERLTDFAVCAEGVEFKVHRVALASSSKYFLNLFESGMCDASDATHTLEGIRPAALEALLAFIYEGKCEIDEGLLT